MAQLCQIFWMDAQFVWAISTVLRHKDLGGREARKAQMMDEENWKFVVDFGRAEHVALTHEARTLRHSELQAAQLRVGEKKKKLSS